MASLHDDIEEETYMDHPKGYRKRRKDILVSRLKKHLYG